MTKINCFWFRRDLRLKDNAGLYHALRAGLPVLPVFIFDRNILDQLADQEDARLHFIHQTLGELSQELEHYGSSLWLGQGNPETLWQQITKKYAVQNVFCNRDYEPYAIQRDKTVQDQLEKDNIGFKTYKDHVIFERGEVLKKDGNPYTVFTPYSRKWKEKLLDRMDHKASYYFKSYPTLAYTQHFYSTKALPIPSLDELGFRPSTITFPPSKVNQDLICKYSETRDFPAIPGTSRLGIHFRFGTISIREKARNAQQLNDTFLNELIWRDFYAMILAHFPDVVKGPFRKKYEWIKWRNKEAEFQAWCDGKTGYPIVDAGMRELNATGYMHNRVRMVVASFLTKHLLIDWTWGEAYFAQKLLDFDLASNNGGWQWAAGCGTDAAPYFRIFNPISQQQKFDKAFIYIRKWVPEYGTDTYVAPIVDHKLARERCLEAYKAGLAEAEEIKNAFL